MIVSQDDAKQAWATLASYGVKALLAKPESNPKLAKGMKLGILSAPLHLAPARLSGFNVCPMATNGCKAACLHTAGNPAAMVGKTRARTAKTIAYFKARDAFMVALADDITKLERKAERLNMLCAVRLNATSDIPWERIPVIGFDGRKYENIIRAFPQITFYDYTKIANRRNLPANYSLTFSLAENNDSKALEALRSGHNVAVVFDATKGKPLPDAMRWNGARFEAFNTASVASDSAMRALYRSGDYWPVLDGDESDFRPWDPKGFFIGLHAKGKAKGDTSGFVRSSKS